MEKITVTVRGDSMWPTLKDGQQLECIKYDNQPINVGQVVVFSNPFDSSILLIKRVVDKAGEKVFVAGDNPDPTSSHDSHNFGSINIASIIALTVERA